MDNMKKIFSVTKSFRFFIILSCLLCVTGVAGLVLLPFGVTLFNFDIDFLGGVVTVYELGSDVTREQIDKTKEIVLEVTGREASSVLMSGREMTVKTMELTPDQAATLSNRILSEFDSATLIDTNEVGTSIGNDLKRSAVLSAIVASLLILVYITIRFELMSGLAAVIALIHDLFLMLSAYIIFQIPMNMNFIAAALTILGYSINATIIVFDRVRENRRFMQKSAPDTLADLSVNQTMLRNINTTITTLLPLVMIIILGVDSVRNFAIPLAIGIISGAYSSICLAAPLWVVFKNGSGKKA